MGLAATAQAAGGVFQSGVHVRSYGSQDGVRFVAGPRDLDSPIHPGVRTGGSAAMPRRRYVADDVLSVEAGFARTDAFTRAVER